MNFSAVYHRTSDNYCYPLNREELIVNIKTGYDVKQVFIHYGDPFEAGILGGNEKWHATREEIPYMKRLKHQIWWTTTLKPEFKRCKYFFELITESQVWYYFEDGFLDDRQLHLSGKTLQCFIFPWMNEKDINTTPYWVNQTVWYEIFPERFFNGDKSNDRDCVKPWRTGEVNNSEFFGGDLEGIKQKLHYLEDLGITGIYLTPINESPSSHKYDSTNYKKIDSHFGDEKVFSELVVAAHKKGIRVMLDGVFNHSGKNFAPWLDVVEHGTASKYYDWFMVNEWPFSQEGNASRLGQYYTFAFIDKMPKLNTNNPEVMEYLIEVCETWVKNYDVDGIRLDVANEISHEFCKLLRKKMKAIKPDIYIVGEIWHDSIGWLRNDEFDAVMNYPLTGTISDFWIDEELSKEDFEYNINRCYTMYMQQSNDVLFNLLDSHDTERLMSRVGNLSVFYQQLAALFTMPGSPCIFYGTEVALEGAHDPDCRRCMPWDEIEAGVYQERIDIVKQLIQLRKEEPLFRSRNFHFPNEIRNKRVIEYIKLDEKGNRLEVIINCSKDVIVLKENKDVVFSLLCENDRLLPNGVRISKY